MINVITKRSSSIIIINNTTVTNNNMMIMMIKDKGYCLVVQQCNSITTFFIKSFTMPQAGRIETVYCICCVLLQVVVWERVITAQTVPNISTKRNRNIANLESPQLNEGMLDLVFS